MRVFPPESEVELIPGRYDSSPPFDFDFTFEIAEPGWQTAHILDEFFDVMRFDGPDPRTPTLWVAWAHPQTVHGDQDAPATDLTPDEAAALMSTQSYVEAGQARPFEFAGLDGVQADYHTDVGFVALFGGPAGDFRLDTSHDARIGIVKVGEEMLLVMCLAAPGEMDDGCEEAQSILDSVQLGYAPP